MANPSLYQINTRVWLSERAAVLSRPATLDDFPDAELDRLAGQGFDWIWLLGVWRTGEAGAFHVTIPNGAKSSGAFCRISKKAISVDPALP